MAEQAAPPPAPIVLVGMPGAGKSSVGRRLAKRLGRPFVDADDELVRRSGRSVRDWFAAEGEAAFRAAEADLLADLLSAPGPAVVAAGGGAVLAPGTRDLLRDRALVVWLRAGVPYLASRVAQKPGHRPLLDDDPVAALTRLAEARTPLYEEVAALTVDVEPFRVAHDKPKRELAARLAELITQAEAAETAETAGELGGRCGTNVPHPPPSSQGVGS
ncbi:AAA family ATPase [Iamia sp. SCSIO 61187]|uniref:shikimate kinase n=1 Tax=Iamia sp. SCSIO 61187 TaxID=2722752 RepID=UPI001C62E003|nr:shikimate kinase [Iamia sp. SCSIO 61187]QYG93104.1 AAA family ATPase [Iamia sp. SCSIO 61187]